MEYIHNERIIAANSLSSFKIKFEHHYKASATPELLVNFKNL